MSYLEMTEAPIPDMNKGIISLWFRDVTAGTVPPAQKWPDGMVPPDTQTIVKTLSPAAVFFWNAYGMPLPLFGGLAGPASVYMPTPPPFPVNSLHMLLTFGNPKQSYNYYPWQVEFPGVIEGVNYTGSTGTGIGFQPEEYPPPYAPYFHNRGADGKFKVATMKIDSTVSLPDMVPQSFIGVDKDGYLTICLQTDTQAAYKGCAYMLDTVTEMWAAATFLKIDGPPYTYTQIGFPYPDGHWVQVEGYWNGYQFEYKDVSNEVMGAQPETFVIGGPGVFLDFVPGPRVSGKGWHHLLFSFDISGSVTSQQSDARVPTATTACKAWLAVDDLNYTGMALQRRLKVHDGFILPLLPGMRGDITGFGPVTSYGRSAFTSSLGSNGILPQNVWIAGFKGNPRDGLLRYVSSSPIQEIGNEWVPAGDFNALAWAGSEWPLYGHGVAPGPWLPILTPPRPTVADPATDLDLPQYACASFNIPVNGHPIGIPTSARHLEYNTGIEMGELQIWVNKTIDTGDVNMRRLFVDKDGKPMKPHVAEERLGKPDILLHGTANWKTGRNTGKSGIDVDNKVIPAGQFNRIAKIEKFLPDPQLHK